MNLAAMLQQTVTPFAEWTPPNPKTVRAQEIEQELEQILLLFSDGKKLTALEVAERVGTSRHRAYERLEKLIERRSINVKRGKRGKNTRSYYFKR